MLRLIVKIGNTFKTYDFECQKLQEEFRGGDLIGLETLWTGKPRLMSFDQKVPAIKAIREHTGMGLREAKEFVESAPVDLPEIEPSLLTKLVSDLRATGAIVEA